MEIAFDPAKRLATLSERGLDLADAAEVFDTEILTVVDDRKDYGEPRWVTVGYLRGRMVVIVWTQRDATLRITSMRKANDREQNLYS